MKQGFFDRFKDWLVRWLSVASLGSLENASALSQLSGMWRSFHGAIWKRLNKKNVIIFFLLIISGPAWAQLRPDQKWIEQVDVGWVFPASSMISKTYATGYGGDVVVGYRFDRDLSLSTVLGYYDCDRNDQAGAADGEWIYVPLMEMVRMNFGNGWVRPFVLFGLGASFNSYSAMVPSQTGKTTSTQTGFLLAPGAGVLFTIFADAALYVQTRFDLNFVAGSSVIPVADSPSLFVPVKAGLSFFVL